MRIENPFKIFQIPFYIAQYAACLDMEEVGGGL